MNITTAKAQDLPRLEPLAREFYAASEFLVGFDLDKFILTWTRLLESETGAIFLLEAGGEIPGALGGVIYPEPYSGDLIATEFFWFVTAKARGGRGGIHLLQAFEAWARKRGAVQIRMVHLLDSMPEKLERVYRHFGYKPAEVHYTKGI